MGFLKNRTGARPQTIKKGPSVARTRMLDLTSLTDAGVIVFVNNTQLDAAVLSCFHEPLSCTQKSYPVHFPVCAQPPST